MAKIDLKDLKELKELTGLSGIDRDALLNKSRIKERRTREAFLPHSNYNVVISAFSRKELLHLQSLIRREEIYRYEAYKIIHEHIVETSLGDLTFKEFLENTSFLDLETLAFLAYTSTFKDKGTYTFECPNPDCGHVIEIKLNNDSLIKIDNTDLYETMRTDALKKEYSLDELRDDPDFFINKVTALKLDDTGFIVLLKEPTLGKDAWTLKMAKDPRIGDDTGMLAALECVEEIRIPVEGDQVIIIDNKEDILTELHKLDKTSFYDLKEIIDTSEDILYGALINYQIDEVKCPHCKEVYRDLPISMSNILFYSIYAEV